MALEGYRKRLDRQLRDRLEKVARVLEERIRQNISLEDHSLKDLRELGHPYAAARPRDIHTPSYQVHTQEGTLLGALRVEIDGDRVLIGVDDEEAPHAASVIFGTPRMVSRNFILQSFEEVRDEITAILRA